MNRMESRSAQGEAGRSRSRGGRIALTVFGVTQTSLFVLLLAAAISRRRPNRP